VRVSEGRRPGLVAAIVVGVALVAFSSPAGAAEVSWMQGFDDPATPNSLDRVGVLKVGPERAKNVLVLNPGTSAGAAYFKPLAEDVVSETDGRWQVWSVERRENQLEDHSLLDSSKLGTASPQEVFDYYLGWLVDPNVTTHFQLVPDSSVAFARSWGMNVEIQDLRRVVEAARAGGRRVVLGGHSLGGSITTAYATWDFKGRPAARDVSGLVYIDGASNPTPIPPEQAGQSLQELQNGSPWLAFGGIPAPFLGIFSATGSTATVVAPDASSLGWSFPLLPANLKPPVQPTNEAQFGYAIDTETSPPSLAAAQVHAGRLAASGSPRGWDRAGEITPIQRYADMLSGTGLTGMDGSAWYHPMRLTLDSRAVANGNANPAQSVLGVEATHGDDLSKHTPIYAFGASLGGDGVLEAARLLARQSGIPDDRLTLVNRQATYAHNDPNAASPQNEFVEHLIPFLAEIGKR
jgi:pimeloyl-ACP methyl ester carboxylesterase